MKSFVSKEREKEYQEICQKHLMAFGTELKERGFCPVPAFIGCNALYELDYVMKQDYKTHKEQKWKKHR